MVSALLLLTVTVLYAGYNLLIKASGMHVPAQATTTILATLCLQVAALGTTLVFTAALLTRGQHVLQLSTGAYVWAAAAGLCIGGAEIAYFYLFGGVGTGRAMPANVAIPTIVSGTIVITMIVGYFAFAERMTWSQFLGSALILLGIGLLFRGKEMLPG